VIFYRKIEWAGIKSEGVNSVIGYIKQNPGKRAPYIAKAISIPLKTLERWLKKLKFEGKIKYEGSAKTGGYYLVDKPRGDGLASDRPQAKRPWFAFR